MENRFNDDSRANHDIATEYKKFVDDKERESNQNSGIIVRIKGLFSSVAKYIFSCILMFISFLSCTFCKWSRIC